jgi:hypothetical protein
VLEFRRADAYTSGTASASEWACTQASVATTKRCLAERLLAEHAALQ